MLPTAMNTQLMTVIESGRLFKDYAVC
jgi:hypothetical protein